MARAIPAVWELITAPDALQVRTAGAVAALRGLLAGQETAVAAAADLLWEAIGELDFAGRALAAGNVALPVPAHAWARLWLAATVLREHRGDGHFAALAAADIDGCEAVALRCLLDLRREDLQPVRGWTDEQWDAALARLAGRGWLGADGQLTGAGHDGARGRGGRHRPGRVARVGAARRGHHGRDRTGAHAAVAGLRGHPPLPQPDRGTPAGCVGTVAGEGLAGFPGRAEVKTVSIC